MRLAFLSGLCVSENCILRLFRSEPRVTRKSANYRQRNYDFFRLLPVVKDLLLEVGTSLITFVFTSTLSEQTRESILV